MTPEMRARLGKAIGGGLSRRGCQTHEDTEADVTRAVVAWLEAEESAGRIAVSHDFVVTEETGIPAGAVLELSGAQVVDGRAESMEREGLGPEDMVNDITYPHGD